MFYCCSLIPFSFLHSEDWRCPVVAGALLSLCCAVVSHLPLVPLSVTAALCASADCMSLCGMSAFAVGSLQFPLLAFVSLVCGAEGETWARRAHHG